MSPWNLSTFPKPSARLCDCSELMDVTCERCGTEYEFDETLLSGRGTSVKCTNCGHVFKVYPKAPKDADRSTSTWRLMRQDGTVDTIDSLRELQRRIGSGELTLSDQISRGNEGWKPLGSIPELETFFQAAEGGGQAKIPSREPPAPAASASDSSLPPRRRPRQPTLLGVVPVPGPAPQGGPGPRTPGAESEVGNENVTAPVNVSGSVRLPETGDESVSASPSATDSLTLPEAPASSSKAGIEDAQLEEPTSSRRRSAPSPAYYDDDEDIPELPGRGWSPTRWLVLIVLGGGLVLVGIQWQRVVGMLGFGSAPEAAAAAIQEGDLALAADHLEAYESAIAFYDRALQAGDEEDAKILIQLAGAHALAAQAMNDRARAGGDETTSETHAKAALNYAEQALMIDAQVLEARLAEADGLRLRGDTERARESLERGRLMPFSRTAEFFRIDSLLQAAEHDGRLEKGLLSAKQAAALAPDGIRYRLLLARAELASGDPDRARTAAEAVLAIAPSHPAAAALLAQLEEVGTVADAGAGTDAGAGSEAASAAASGAAPEAAAGSETAAGSEAASAPASGAAARSEDGTESVKAKVARGKRAAESRRRAAQSRKRPEYDEYDRLAEAAGSDAFIDGRPPVRDFGWYMREGEAALAGGDYAKAHAFFESALEARPGSGDATDALGRVAFALGNFELSLRYFRSAAQRGHPDGYYNLGRAYERLGRNDKAVSAYYTYLKRRPSGIHVADARTAIKKLEPRVKLPETEETTPKPGSEPESEAPSEPTQESEVASP